MNRLESTMKGFGDKFTRPTDEQAKSRRFDQFEAQFESMQLQYEAKFATLKPIVQTSSLPVISRVVQPSSPTAHFTTQFQPDIT